MSPVDSGFGLILVCPGQGWCDGSAGVGEGTGQLRWQEYSREDGAGLISKTHAIVLSSVEMFHPFPGDCTD